MMKHTAGSDSQSRTDMTPQHCVTANYQVSSQDLNNRGIGLMQVGHETEAIETFRHALECVKDSFDEENFEDNMIVSIIPSSSNHVGENNTSAASAPMTYNRCDSLESDNGVHGISRMYTSIKAIPLKDIKVSATVRSHSSNDVSRTNHPKEDLSFITIFDRALYIDECCCGDEGATEMNRGILGPEFLSSLITYNMALASHTLGLKNGSSKCLFKALQLYEIAHKILTEYIEYEQQQYTMDGCGFLQFNENITFLLMVLLNNMGHILASLYRLNEMRCVLHLLRELLSDVYADMDYSNAIGNSKKVNMLQAPKLPSEDFIIFFMNAMMVQESVLSVPPAA